ncbi:transglycosylase domain-containing protein [Sinomonas mesophila]|uniref:transglycosylase domain-containing protein n=1 Tax=Sinomonas mesophila TaxID=1531955 RepID=UPI000987C502|nr:transglycosylase domain-containing protein [Sinomonas mesophila]
MSFLDGMPTALKSLTTFFAVSALCGVLAVGFLAPVTVATWAAADSSAKFFDSLPTELEVTPPALVTKILAADGSLIGTVFTQNRTPVTLDQISQHAKDALIAIEDYRFYEHGGVDPTGVVRAAIANLRGDRQGASTLTQQYVANVLKENKLARGGDPAAVLTGPKSLGDKLREMKLAIALEKRYSKEQILEGYLNIVYFSTHAYGIQAASQYFFTVDAKDLSLPQAALLAGIVNGPSVYSPTTQPDAALERRNLVLDTMLERGYITQEQHDEAVATPIELRLSPSRQGCAYAVQAQYFCDYVLHQVLNDPAYGATPEDRALTVQRSGLVITTTLDPRLQGPAQTQVDATAGANPDRWGASLVTVQPGTGRVLSMAQNTRMLEGQGLDFVTSYNFNVDRTDANGNQLGGAGGFQPGSAMKPVTLAAWLSEGKPTDQVVNAAQRRYPLNHPWRNTCARVTGAFDDTTVSLGTAPDLRNNDEGWYRPLTVREGVYNSINTATFASAAGLRDFCSIQRAADALGMHDGEGRAAPLDMSTLGNLLGGPNVSPLTMANAFATFAANGTHCVPISITEVKDANGNRLGGQTPQCRAGALSPDVAKAATNVLQDVLTKGSGYHIKDNSDRTISIGAPAAAKTGTNQFNSQTWVMGYTRGLSTASFFGEALGNPEDRVGRNVVINGKFWPNIDGAYIAGPQWAYYMRTVLVHYDRGGFDPPPPHLIRAGAPPPRP